MTNLPLISHTPDLTSVSQVWSPTSATSLEATKKIQLIQYPRERKRRPANQDYSTLSWSSSSKSIRCNRSADRCCRPQDLQSVSHVLGPVEQQLGTTTAAVPNWRYQFRCRFQSLPRREGSFIWIFQKATFPSALSDFGLPDFLGPRRGKLTTDWLLLVTAAGATGHVFFLSFFDFKWSRLDADDQVLVRIFFSGDKGARVKTMFGKMDGFGRSEIVAMWQVARNVTRFVVLIAWCSSGGRQTTVTGWVFWEGHRGYVFWNLRIDVVSNALKIRYVFSILYYCDHWFDGFLIFH